MTRDQPCQIGPGIDSELTLKERAERERFSDVKFSKGAKGASERTSELFEVELSEHFFRRAISKKKLAYNVIGHCVYISDRQLYDFIVLSTRRNTQTEASA